VTPASTLPKVATLYLLTEDSGKHANATMRSLLEHMLRVLMDNNIHLECVDLRPLEDERHLYILRGNHWRSTSKKPASRQDEMKIRELCSWIRLRLTRGEFVLFHYDGDTVWSLRNESQNQNQHFPKLREGVLRALLQAGESSPGSRSSVTPAAALSSDEANLALARLLEIVPFYSIEAWLFRNFDRAEELCREWPCGKHITSTIAAWRGDPTRLDEQSKPKEELCFKAEYNADLAASGFPSQDLYKQHASFYEAVEALRRCDQLMKKLDQARYENLYGAG
jgi:hypothetical protein